MAALLGCRFQLLLNTRARHPICASPASFAALEPFPQCQLGCRSGAFASRRLRSLLSSRGRRMQHRCSICVHASLDAASTSNYDLLVVGPGVLGSYVGILWQQHHPSAQVTGQTNSTANHDRLKQMHIKPRTKTQADGQKFPYVLFSAPPSGSEDYPAEAAAAAKFWDGSGALVFTSSAGLYEVDDGSLCNEDCKTAERGSSERTDKLLAAEEAVLGAGGIVIRLVGLYHSGRGAHTFFLRQGQVARWGGYTVNLIHYEDAARLCVAALDSSSDNRGRVFVGADGSPITFEEMMEACSSSGKYPGSVQFTGQESSSKKGKLMSNCQTREALSWQPKYPSFDEFMASGANDFYNSSNLYAAKQEA